AWAMKWLRWWGCSSCREAGFDSLFVLKVLGIIPARGGSKGIPRKNLSPLGGKPLLYYTIRAAQASSRLRRTILSSEDQEINDVGRSLGIDVPFARPADLATDEARSVEVARHALQFAENEEGARYDLVCLLQPTCPLRAPSDIDGAIEMLDRSDADGVVSLARVEDPHPVKMMLVTDELVHPLFPDRWRETVRRQELAPVFYLNGAVYCVRREVLLNSHSLWGKKTLAYIMPAERSVNVDTLLDLKLAECLLTVSVEAVGG
ncbi:MAG: cytidylyltransferase domain-containing protein, partial [Candidatus Binatia bacterium]